MNIATLIGFVSGLGVLGWAILNATGNAHIFWNPHGLAVVLGGVLAATFICYPLKDVLRIFGAFIKVLRREDLPISNYVEVLIVLAQRAMVKGPLKLEKKLDGIENFFLQDGLRMIIDQYPEAKIRRTMETTIDTVIEREYREAEIFRTMGRLAPAFGMIGTLIGLIVMFQNLQQDPAAIGPAMGVALMSTFYGLLLANLILNPIAVKMERRAGQRETLMQAITEGVILIARRTPPQVVRDELQVFLPTRRWSDSRAKRVREMTAAETVVAPPGSPAAAALERAGAKARPRRS